MREQHLDGNRLPPGCCSFFALLKKMTMRTFTLRSRWKNSDVDIRIFSPEILGSCYNNIITDSIDPSQRETYRHKSVGEKNERK